MSDESLNLLREAHQKAAAKVSRLSSQLEIAQRDFDETATALKVMERLLGGSGASSVQTGQPISDVSAVILAKVPVGKASSVAPKDVIDALMADGRDDLNADQIRTQLWRMAKREILVSDEGRYWKPEKASNDERASADLSAEALRDMGPATGRGTVFPATPPEGSIPSGSTPASHSDPLRKEDDDFTDFG